MEWNRCRKEFRGIATGAPDECECDRDQDHGKQCGEELANQSRPQQQKRDQEENRSLRAQREVFVCLTRPLLAPFPETWRSLLHEKVVRVADRRAATREVTNDFLVVEKHIAIVMTDAEHRRAAKCARAWIIGGSK